MPPHEADHEMFRAALYLGKKKKKKKGLSCAVFQKYLMGILSKTYLRSISLFVKVNNPRYFNC